MVFGAAFLFNSCSTVTTNDTVSTQENSNTEEKTFRDTSLFLTYEWQPGTHQLSFLLNHPDGYPFKTFFALQDHLKVQEKKLLFAMNGGMFRKDFSPVGLYVENGIELQPLITKQEGYGNFFLQPNGVFFLREDDTPAVSTTMNYDSAGVKFATQSGPMLLIDGAIHPAFNADSENKNIRNGVGILPSGNVLFCISTRKVTFYALASFFLEKECENALYLDGFVSEAYIPEKGMAEDGGPFGVMIGVYE